MPQDRLAFQHRFPFAVHLRLLLCRAAFDLEPKPRIHGAFSPASPQIGLRRLDRFVTTTAQHRAQHVEAERPRPLQLRQHRKFMLDAITSVSGSPGCANAVSHRQSLRGLLPLAWVWLVALAFDFDCQGHGFFKFADRSSWRSTRRLALASIVRCCIVANSKVGVTFPARFPPPCNRLVQTNLDRRNFRNYKNRDADNASGHHPVEDYCHNFVFLSDGMMTNRDVSVNTYLLPSPFRRL